MEKNTKKTDNKKSKDFDFRSIDSYESACKYKNDDPEAILPDVSKCPPFLQKFVIAAFKLAYTNDIMRNGFKFNWNNSAEWKYQPWHGIKSDSEHPSGFAFSGSDFKYTSTSTDLGSRLLCESSEKAIHFAEIMHPEWMDFKLEIE